MNERDELAKLLFTVDNGGALDPEHEWEMATRHYPLNVEYVHIMADALLAAGYRKPKQVTTAEELEALPFETVIRDGDECVLERWGDLEESGWVTVMVTSFVPRDQITLPATVLYEPEAPK